MADRERAQMQPSNEPTDSTPYYSEIQSIRTALGQIRGFQVDREDSMLRKIEQWEETLESNLVEWNDKLQTSLEKRRELTEKLINIIQGYDNKTEELNQLVNRLVNKKEQELEGALKEVRSLKTEMVAALVKVSERNRPSIRETLYKIGITVGATAMGGIIIFLALAVVMHVTLFKV